MRPERIAPRRRGAGLTGLLAAAGLLALLAAAALGASTVSLKSAPNSQLGKAVLVNQAGRTLYALSGETSHHLLCKSSECAHFWPPLTVPSRSTRLRAATGVHGTLGTIRRPNGSLQVTLRGKPLYRYSGDHGAGQANGEGIQSFGGTWHAVTPSSAPQAPAPAPMSGESTPPYGY